MIRMLSVSLITLGDPGQLTGGYLYHRRMAEAAPAHNVRLQFVSFPALPFPLPAARAGVVLRRASSLADVLILDAVKIATGAGVKLPEGKVLIPGVIESKSNFVEHPELVAQRIGRYANLVGPENVMAGSDCGFQGFK